MTPVITIDGPVASGKGTVARKVAEALGFHLLDSGAIYRAHALACLSRNLDFNEINVLEEQAKALSLKFDGETVWIDGVDATEKVRSEAAGMDASRVSALPSVREALLNLQHGFARLPGLVADGRDMGTQIFPFAPLKVFLTADAAQRADRRHKQLISKGISANIDSLRADLAARDARDSSRAVAPLKPAQDALLLDNSQLTIDESVNQVLAWWQARQPF